MGAEVPSACRVARTHAYHAHRSGKHPLCGAGAHTRRIASHTQIYIIRRKYRHTTLHVILLGVGGFIYKSYTDEPLLQLGLDRSGAAKLVHQLHTHAVQYASKIVQTRRGLEFAASASNPRDPH